MFIKTVECNTHETSALNIFPPDVRFDHTILKAKIFQPDDAVAGPGLSDRSACAIPEPEAIAAPNARARRPAIRNA